MSRVYLTRPEGLDLSFIDIKPNDWVVIKPNLVKESKETDPKEWRSVITDPEMIRKVCRYVCERLSKNGRVTICDAPQTDSSFKIIAERLGLYEIAESCSKEFAVPVEVVDLRNEEWTRVEGVISERKTLRGDPEGVVAFNLGRDSFFYNHPGEGHYYGADYDSAVVNKHHKGERQEYLVCATPIKCDVYINMPKMKTHKKTGVTLSLKNLVGINADKNWLPHHTEGSPKNGGDEYPDLTFFRQIERLAVKVARAIALRLPGLGPLIAQKLRKAGTSVFGAGDTVIRSGNWYGNNTCWRMVLDLNRCLLYGAEDGTLNPNKRKRYYSVIDGGIGMEGSGPMQGDPIKSNLVVAGDNPFCVDMVAARVMGFDYQKIPVLMNAVGDRKFSIFDGDVQAIEVVSDIEGWGGSFDVFMRGSYLNFEPHFGWKGHVEYKGGR